MRNSIYGAEKQSTSEKRDILYSMIEWKEKKKQDSSEEIMQNPREKHQDRIEGGRYTLMPRGFQVIR